MLDCNRDQRECAQRIPANHVLAAPSIAPLQSPPVDIGQERLRPGMSPLRWHRQPMHRDLRVLRNALAREIELRQLELRILIVEELRRMPQKLCSSSRVGLDPDLRQPVLDVACKG